MLTEAHVRSERAGHGVTLATDGTAQHVAIASKPNGRGSAANGGELLCLALATCYCNDIYREAAKRDIVVERVDVDARAEFGAAGEPAKSLRYRATVYAQATEAQIRDLMLHTDRVAEIQNTLRKGMDVMLETADARPVDASTASS